MLVERTFDAGDVRINYAEERGDGPPLLLIHGVTSRWQNWLNVMPVLTQRWRVIAVDLRGHGRSSHAEGRYGLMEYAADIIGLVRHLTDEPAILVGHSLGGMISIGVASEAPELVRAVALEDPPLGAFEGQPFGGRPEHQRFIAMRDLARLGLTPVELAKRLAADIPEGNAVSMRARAAALSRIDPEVLTAIIENRSIERYDLGERLRGITVPTLLLQGNPELGGALADAKAAWAAAQIPDCAHVYQSNVGHGIHVSDGPAFSQNVVTFLEAL